MHQPYTLDLDVAPALVASLASIDVIVRLFNSLRDNTDVAKP